MKFNPSNLLITLGIAGLTYWVLSSHKTLSIGAGQAAGLWQDPASGKLFVAYLHGTDTTGAPGTAAGTFPNPQDGKQYDLFDITGVAVSPPIPPAAVPPPVETPPAATPPAAPDQSAIDDAVKKALKKQKKDEADKANAPDDTEQQTIKKRNKKIKEVQIPDQNISSGNDDPFTGGSNPSPSPPPPPAPSGGLITLGDPSLAPDMGQVAQVDLFYSERAYVIPNKRQGLNNLRRVRIGLA